MKIANFGGGGIIGSAISDRLLKGGMNYVFLRSPCVVPYRQYSEDERVAWHTGKLMSAHDVSKAIEEADALLHLAATTLPNK